MDRGCEPAEIYSKPSMYNKYDQNNGIVKSVEKLMCNHSAYDLVSCYVGS